MFGDKSWCTFSRVFHLSHGRPNARMYEDGTAFL